MNARNALILGLLSLIMLPAAAGDEPPSPRDELISLQLRFVRGIDEEKMLNQESDWVDPGFTAEAQRVYQVRALRYIPSDLTAEEVSYLKEVPTGCNLEGVHYNEPAVLEAWADAHLLCLAAKICDLRHAVVASAEDKAAYERAIDAYLEGFNREMALATFSMVPMRYIQDAERRFRMDLVALLHRPGVSKLTVPDAATVNRLRTELFEQMRVRCEETLQTMGVIEHEVSREQIEILVRQTTGTYIFSKWFEEPLRDFHVTCGWNPEAGDPCKWAHDRAQEAHDQYYALVRDRLDAFMEEMARQHSQVNDGTP